MQSSSPTAISCARLQMPERQSGLRRRILVVGSGTYFLSGISVYTVRLANALVERHRVGVITMRRLLPARLYPGWKRVGQRLARFAPDDAVSRFDGVDWFWVPSMFGAVRFLIRQRPQVVIFQWWTGTVLHSYIVLALVARLIRARIIVEFHEVLDTGEANIPLAHHYVRTFAPMLMRLADGFAVHSQFDHDLVKKTWSLGSRRPIAVLPHGPHDHYQSTTNDAPRSRDAPPGVCNLLFFGVIRPFKGLEHLLEAFESLSEEDIKQFWLTVVGETWENWTLPAEMIERSPRRDRISFVNRYVSDEELHDYLVGCDAVVLPYLRSSLSGPLHVAMGYGKPVVMTSVGGNVEAADGYEGIVLVPPANPECIGCSPTPASGDGRQRLCPPEVVGGHGQCL